MSNWLTHWLQNQKQTQRFHPSWILIGVVVTILIGGIMWGIAEWVAKAEYERIPNDTRVLPPPPGQDAMQGGQTPAAIMQPRLPVRNSQKIIRVGYTRSDTEGIPDARFWPAGDWDRMSNDAGHYADQAIGVDCANCNTPLPTPHRRQL